MKQTNKSVSFIIPHHDLGKGMNKLLRSIEIMKQVSKEVIVVDDHSDSQKFDELQEMCNASILDIRIISNSSTHLGAGASRNIGIKHAVGDWLIFADADDHFTKGAEAAITDALQTGKETDVVYFPPTSTDETGKTGHRHDTYLSYFEPYWENGDESYLRYALTVIWSRMYRRTFVENKSIVFDNDIVSNDVMFANRVGVLSGTIKVVNSEIYSWDFKNDSITTNMPISKFYTNFSVFLKSQKFLKNELDISTFKKIRVSAMKFIVMSLFRYKLGVKTTFWILKGAIKNDVPILQLKDFRRIRTFFVNNSLYKKQKR
jgi:glycosyltransferase involved in cell wall biosynthesis